MIRNYSSYFILFVCLVAAQAVIFNRIWLFHVAMPLVFIYFIITMPVDMNMRWQLTLSFLLGFTVDIFSDTPGLNALCCTITGALRNPILKLYEPREDEMVNPIPSPRTIGWITYMKYLITMTTLYSVLFFIVLSFSFFDVGRMLSQIIASSLLTFLIILAFSNFVVPTAVSRK